MIKHTCCLRGYIPMSFTYGSRKRMGNKATVMREATRRETDVGPT